MESSMGKGTKSSVDFWVGRKLGGKQANRPGANVSASLSRKTICLRSGEFRVKEGLICCVKVVHWFCKAHRAGYKDKG